MGDLKTFVLSDCLERQRPQSSPCLHCRAVGCSLIPSLRVMFCSSHVHPTHSLDGDLLAAATRSKERDWEKHLSGRLNSAIFFPLLLCELPVGR